MNRLTNKNDCWPPVVLLLKPNGSVVSFCVVYCILSIWILLLLKTDSDSSHMYVIFWLIDWCWHIR